METSESELELQKAAEPYMQMLSDGTLSMHQWRRGIVPSKDKAFAALYEAGHLMRRRMPDRHLFDKTGEVVYEYRLPAEDE